MEHNQLTEALDTAAWTHDRAGVGTAVLEPGLIEELDTQRWSENIRCDVDDDLDDDEAYFLEDDDDDDDDFGDDYDDDEFEDEEFEDDSEEEFDDDDL